MHKAARKPWPQLDSDEVVDYLVMEAVAIKTGREEADARKQAEIEQWKKQRGKEIEELF